MNIKNSNLSKKKAAFVAVSVFSIFLIISCASCESKKDKNVAAPEPPAVEAEAKEPAVVEEAAPEPVPEKEPEPAPEPAKEAEPEPEPIPEPEPAVEPEPEPKVEEVKEEPKKEEPKDEYERSVGDVAVSRDTFEKDKEKILEIISELDKVMKDFDYRSWLNYVDKQSIDYWSRPANLKKAQSRLPVKGLRLTSLQDYFKYVFVPARKGRKVTEIRYVSDTYIKAIEVGEDQDIVYYYFNKIDGSWMVNLPPIED